MRSAATTVDEYLAGVADDRRPAIERLRALCRAHLAGYEEAMEYGMPSYRRPGGEVEVAFANQARYVSLYILRQDVLDRFRDRLTDANLGKGCVRYTDPGRIDDDVVADLLRESAAASGPIC